MRQAPVGALVVVAGTLTGLAVVAVPQTAWMLVGAAISVLLLLAPAPVLVGSTVLAATGSRLLVATGFFPESLNFFHFPLVLCAALSSLIETRIRSPLRRKLGFGIAGLLCICLLSWIVNGGHPLRPFLVWFVFAEPFLLILALVAAPLSPQKQKVLWALVLAVSFVQFLLAVYQALALGLSDPVQGFFLGLGAGAHVAGAVSLLGSLICLAKSVSGAGLKSRVLWLSGGILLFLVAILADAKQVILAYFPALLLLLLGLVKLRWTRLVVALPILAGITLGAFSYYRPLQMALDWMLISRGILGKMQAFFLIASRLSSDASGWILGLGPGNSVSRVALMGLEAYRKTGSPLQLLGLNAAPATQELWNLSASNRLFAASSVWSSLSSWLGLLGDLGLAGLACYLWLFWSLWWGMRSLRGWKTRLARAVLIMCAVLGFMFSWLEEPGFMIPAALVMGLGLAGAGEGRAGNEDSPGP